MNEKSRAEEAIQNVRQYLEAKWDLFLLNTVDKISSAFSSLVTAILIGLFLVFVLFFASVALAFMIGKAVESTIAGFAIVGGIYLLLCIIVYSMRNKWIKFPVINRILGQLHYHEKD